MLWLTGPWSLSHPLNLFNPCQSPTLRVLNANHPSGAGGGIHWPIGHSLRTIMDHWWSGGSCRDAVGTPSGRQALGVALSLDSSRQHRVSIASASPPQRLGSLGPVGHGDVTRCVSCPAVGQRAGQGRTEHVPFLRPCTSCLPRFNSITLSFYRSLRSYSVGLTTLSELFSRLVTKGS